MKTFNNLFEVPVYSFEDNITITLCLHHHGQEGITKGCLLKELILAGETKYDSSTLKEQFESKLMC